MRLKKFTNPKFLQQIGREMLSEFVVRYEADFAEAGLQLPSSVHTDQEYLEAFGRMCLGDPGLPEAFAEALYGLEIMANPAGRERVLALARARGLDVHPEDATDAELALQVFMAAPEVLLEEAEIARVQRLSAFAYYVPGPQARACVSPTDWEAAAARVKADIDAWQVEQRDQQERITRVEHHTSGSEHWFLIRRGDAFVRVPTVENNTFAIRYFRPARDLVVIYSPTEKELRIHARSPREKAMLRRVFGQQLCGNAEHFSWSRTFTLAPLKRCGAEALAANHLHGIEHVSLVGLDMRTGGEHPLRIEYASTDLLAWAHGKLEVAVSSDCELTAAVFEVRFAGKSKPRKLRISTPNVLRVSRFCDTGAVYAWLSERGYRATSNTPEEANERERVELA